MEAACLLKSIPSGGLPEAASVARSIPILHTGGWLRCLRTLGRSLIAHGMRKKYSSSKFEITIIISPAISISYFSYRPESLRGFPALYFMMKVTI